MNNLSWIPHERFWLYHTVGMLEEILSLLNSLEHSNDSKSILSLSWNFSLEWLISKEIKVHLNFQVISLTFLQVHLWHEGWLFSESLESMVKSFWKYIVEWMRREISRQYLMSIITRVFSLKTLCKLTVNSQ